MIGFEGKAYLRGYFRFTSFIDYKIWRERKKKRKEREKKKRILWDRRR